jgi:hypothetical protein
MKKLLLSLFLVLFAGFALKANDSELFKLDYNATKAEFSELNQLAKMVSADANMTYSSLLLANSNLVASLNLVSESALAGGEKNPVLGIPSFLWGCGLGVVGLLVVYIVSDKDKAETKKAMWGCITSTAVAVIIDIVWWSAIWGSSGVI